MIKFDEEIKKMNLWEKISAISSEIEYLKKDDLVGTGKSSYKAISIEKVMTSVSEKMCKYGIVIYPVEQSYLRTDEKVIGIDYNTKKEVEKINRISDVDVKYEVVNIHNPIEKIITVSSGTGVDTQDKGVGKAMTYAYKNMIIKLFAIATGDDTDKIHSDDYTEKLVNGKVSSNNGSLTEGQIKRLYAIAKKVEVTPTQIVAVIKKDFNKVDVTKLTKQEYDLVCERLENKAKES